MADGTVFPQVQIELVLFFFHTQFIHALFQFGQVFFSLAAADDLTDTGNQTVHGGNRFPVFIELHVEGLDFLGIICHKYRTLEFLLCQETLMLGLQIAAPVYFILEFVVMLLQNIDRFGIGNVAEVGIHDMLQPFDQAFVDELIEKGHFIGRLLQDIADDVFEHILRQFHVILQIREGDLGLDHPEFSRVSGRVGFLRAESGTECINIPESHGVGLHIQLAADGQVGHLAEEITAVIHLAVFCHGDVLQGHRGDLEHLTGAFRVASRNNGGMYVDKASLLEELMDGEGDQGTDPEYRGKGIGPDAQMGDRAQILKAVALFLQGIVGRGSALDLDLLSLHFKGLFGTGRRDDGTGRQDRGADIQFGDSREILQLFAVNDLQGLEAGTVIKDDKSDCLGVTVVTDPAAGCDLFAIERGRVREQISDFCKLILVSHNSSIRSFHQKLLLISYSHIHRRQILIHLPPMPFILYAGIRSMHCRGNAGLQPVRRQILPVLINYNLSLNLVNQKLRLPQSPPAVPDPRDEGHRLSHHRRSHSGLLSASPCLPQALLPDPLPTARLPRS